MDTGEIALAKKGWCAMRNIWKLCAPFLLAALSGGVTAAEFSYGSADESSVDFAVVIKGKIVPGDYERLLDFIEDDPARFRASLILLASPGGDLVESMKIARLVKSTYQSVFVNGAKGSCASACFFIYVSAVERGATNRALGIHRPYFAPENFARKRLAEAEEMQRKLLKEARAFLEDREVPQYLIEEMFSRASDEVYWLDTADEERIGERAHWYDQVLVDRCGLDKELESGFANQGNEYPRLKEARENLEKVWQCSADLTAEESMSNLKAILDARR